MTFPTSPGPAVYRLTDDEDDQTDSFRYENAVPQPRPGVLAWFRHAPAERAPLAGIPAVWTAAEILHTAGVAPVITGAVTVAAAGLAYGLGERRQHHQKPTSPDDSRGDQPASGQDQADDDNDAAAPGQADHPRMRGAELAAATGGVGAWATMAAIWGPLAGPEHLLTWVYVAGMAGGYWWLRSHEAIRAARARRDAAARAAAEAAAREAEWLAKRIAWHQLAVRLRIQGGERSHLLDWTTTPLGESWLVKTTGTGQRASQLATKDLAERIAELGGSLDGTGTPLPAHRVQVTPGPVAGQLRITVRTLTDPWASPIWHPWASGSRDPAARYASLTAPFPVISQPVSLGADPETSRSMPLPLRETAGARHAGIFGTTGAGKTMILDTLRFDVARMPDARFFQINLVKPRAERRWMPLAEGSALIGDPDADARALAILDFLCGVIAVRGQGSQGTRMHQPTPAEPQFVLFIDEVAGTAADPQRKERMRTIARAGRENAVSLVIAGQRPINDEIGGVTIRANLNFYVYGAMIGTDRRRGHGSDQVSLPDMGSYGEGAPGVFGIARMHAGATSLLAQGRAWFWGDDPAGLDQLITRLASGRQPYLPEPAIAADPQLMSLHQIATGATPAAGDSRYDLTRTPDGATVPGTAGVRGKLATAATILDATPSPSGPAPQDTTSPGVGPAAEGDEQALARLRELIARPGGVSRSEAVDALPYQKTKIHLLLAQLREQGFAVQRGEGRAARYHATAPPATGYPPLRAVPDPPPGAPASDRQPAG